MPQMLQMLMHKCTNNAPNAPNANAQTHKQKAPNANAQMHKCTNNAPTAPSTPDAPTALHAFSADERN